ncbi:hypothetical protein AB0D12_11760 [Streptomyces sp. NPDC048479]|uniref:hypothetical protein n=1 Tax=Streptomyces sp. NPDC048479 TaxID=3154725 RepID=UPI003441AB4E
MARRSCPEFRLRGAPAYIEHQPFGDVPGQFEHVRGTEGTQRAAGCLPGIDTTRQISRHVLVSDPQQLDHHLVGRALGTTLGVSARSVGGPPSTSGPDRLIGAMQW